MSVFVCVFVRLCACSALASRARWLGCPFLTLELRNFNGLCACLNPVDLLSYFYVPAHGVLCWCQWLLDNDGAEALCLTFSMTVPRESAESQEGGSGGGSGSSALELELVEDGIQRAVTDSNKREYVALAMRWTLLSAVQAELAAMMAGLYEVVPRELLRVFDYQELELLLCGLS